jgi:hypothetical protein
LIDILQIRNDFESLTTRMQTMVLKLIFHSLFAAALVLSLGQLASAQVLFEGYSKVVMSGEHVGFTVQRYEFDAKKKEYKMVSYLKTNKAAGNLTESITARSDDKMHPLSYQYTSLKTDQALILDATFKGDKLILVKREGGKATSTSRTIPKNAFLSSFLAYVMLIGKEGIKTGAHYDYQAIAEETGALATGTAFVKEQEVISGVQTFRVLNTFQGANFVSNVTAKGEILSTESKKQQIATVLVPTIGEATAGLSVNSSALSLLFGSVPKGMENALSRKGTGGTSLTGVKTAPPKENAEAMEPEPVPADFENGTPAENELKDQAAKKKTLQGTPPSTTSPKKQGVPGGKGVIVKPGEEN